MQNYIFVKNNVLVAKICKYALYESSEGLFCARRKPANFCHPVRNQNNQIFNTISNFSFFDGGCAVVIWCVTTEQKL